jgi:hypothetical protein
MDEPTRYSLTAAVRKGDKQRTDQRPRFKKPGRAQDNAPVMKTAASVLTFCL